MKKMVDGTEVECSPAEEAAILARWAAADAARAVSDQADAARQTRAGALTQEFKSNGAMERLRNASPAQIDAYVDANVTDLAGARAALKALAKAVAYLARGHED